jgi:hypothetical protein
MFAEVPRIALGACDGRPGGSCGTTGGSAGLAGGV